MGVNSTRSRIRAAVAAIAGLGALAVLSTPGAASARVVDSESGSFDFSSTITDFSDVDGLDVDTAGTLSYNYRVVLRGAEKLPYYMETFAVTQTYTNPETNLSVRESIRELDKDLYLEPNDDGTYTLTVLAPGSANVWGPDGRLIARNPGQVRFQLLLDENLDVVEDLGLVKGSTGRNDDFCEAVVPALT
jgi:hypothetical protein